MLDKRPIEHLKRIFSSVPNPASFTVPQMRKGTEALSLSNPPATDLKLKEVHLANVPATWITAPGAVEGRIILYIHGGAFVAGSPQSHCALIGELSRSAQSSVLAVDYRLAPEHVFPAALDDCLSVYEALTCSDDSRHFAVAGDSAGGGLALSTMLEASSRGWKQADAAVLFSPWLDLTCSSFSQTSIGAEDPLLNKDFLTKMASLYLGGANPNSPKVSPLLGAFDRLPPTLVQVGECEILKSDAVAFKQKALDANFDTELQIWPEMFHVWQGYTSILPEAKQALKQAGAYIETQWKT